MSEKDGYAGFVGLSGTNINIHYDYMVCLARHNGIQYYIGTLIRSMRRSDKNEHEYHSSWG
jgi:hypothetical protein